MVIRQKTQRNSKRSTSVHEPKVLAQVKRRIMMGTFVLSAGYYDAYYGKAQKARRMVRDHTENFWSTTISY